MLTTRETPEGAAPPRGGGVSAPQSVHDRDRTSLEDGDHYSWLQVYHELDVDPSGHEIDNRGDRGG